MESDLNGQPIQTQWQTASISAATNCVQVASQANAVVVRHSKYPDGPVLSYTRTEWTAFIDGVKKGELDSFSVG